MYFHCYSGFCFPFQHYVLSYLKGEVFVSFQEVDVPNANNKKSIIVYVPVPQLRQFQKIQPRLVRELEKKFSGKHVVFIARVRRVFSFSGLLHNSYRWAETEVYGGSSHCKIWERPVSATLSTSILNNINFSDVYYQNLSAVRIGNHKSRSAHVHVR